MKKFGYFLFTLGFMVAAFGMSIDTTVEAGGQTFGSGDYSVTVPKTRVVNVGLIEHRRLVLSGAGLLFLVGAVFIGFGTLATNTSQGHSTVLPQATSQQLTQLQKFISGATISPLDVARLASLAEQQPSIAKVTSRTNGNSLLHLAAAYNLHNAVELLLKAGAEKSNRNGNGQRPYQLANNESVANLLRV